MEEIKMTYQEKLDLLEDMMELEENTLSGKENLEDIDEWDSMSKLYLVSWVKKNMKKKLTTEEIVQFRTVNDICEYIQ
jgi:hypothetical protein